MDEIDRQKKKQKLILLDTLGYSWILFFWILGKFLGSKYPSIYDHPPIYNLQNPYLGLGNERRYWGEAVLEGAVWGGGGASVPWGQILENKFFSLSA